MNLTFDKSWNVGGVPTNATSVTIGVYDNTAAVQVVSPGTATTNYATGEYQYVYTSATSGNNYTATWTVVYSGATYVSQAVAVYAGSGVGTGSPIATSADAVTLLQQQLADIMALKTQALSAISTALSAGMGPTYSISGRAGGESLDMAGFLAVMREQIVELTKLERDLLIVLQELQPWHYTAHKHVGYGGMRWH